MRLAGSRKVCTGDVFRLEADGTACAYIQVVVPGNVLYVVALAYGDDGISVLDKPQPFSGAILCGWTLDARIHQGAWKLVGNLPVAANYPRPCYKVLLDGTPWIESFDGEPLRLASRKDLEFFDYRTTVAPVRYEKALAAAYGLAAWNESFDMLRVEYARAREHRQDGKGFKLAE